VGKEGLERVDDIQFGPNATSSCEKKVTRQPVILPNNLTFHDIKYWLGAMEQTIIGCEWVNKGLERVDDGRSGPNATKSCEKKVTQQPVITQISHLS
jgi:hypothetical protein